MPCLCGADDCPRCFPGNFYRGVFLDDETTQEQIDDALEARDVEDYLDRQREMELDCESGRYDP